MQPGFTRSNSRGRFRLGLAVGTNGAGYFVSLDSGATWTARNTGLTNLVIWDMVANPGDSTIGSGFGLPSTALVGGSAVQSGALAETPVIQIGGATARVVFAGVVPAGAATGDHSVTATYAGMTTPAGALIAIAR